MIKNILKSNGETVQMNFEDVINNYSGLVVKIARRYRGLNLTEDDMQEGYLGLWKAFDSYDEKHCFSTHATWQVRQRFQYLKTLETSPVRDTRGKEFVHMEYDLGDGNTLGNVIVDEKSEFEQDILNSDIIQYIKENLNELEMDLLAFNLGYVQAKYIVEKYNTTKQNIANKNARFKVKLQKLIENYNKM